MQKVRFMVFQTLLRPWCRAENEIDVMSFKKGLTKVHIRSLFSAASFWEHKGGAYRLYITTKLTPFISHLFNKHFPLSRASCVCSRALPTHCNEHHTTQGKCTYLES